MRSMRRIAGADMARHVPTMAGGVRWRRVMRRIARADMARHVPTMAWCVIVEENFLGRFFGLFNENYELSDTLI